jgi:hypothetical protein
VSFHAPGMSIGKALFSRLNTGTIGPYYLFSSSGNAVIVLCIKNSEL